MKFKVSNVKSWRRWLVGIIIIFLLVISALVASLVAFVRLDQKLDETRGYGLVGRPDVPFRRAERVLSEIMRFFGEYYEDHPSGKWPDAKVIAENVNDLVLVEKQPYAKFGTYVLSSPKIKQAFLSGSNNLPSGTKLARIVSKLDQRGDKRGLTLCVWICAMATREDPPGVYHAYNDYPLTLKEDIGFDAWKKWCFMAGEEVPYLVYRLQSDVPPIPGCFAYMDHELSKFYYPEDILPIFKAIYPHATIPEEQILREGRDY